MLSILIVGNLSPTVHQMHFTILTLTYADSLKYTIRISATQHTHRETKLYHNGVRYISGSEQSVISFFADTTHL